MDDFAEHLLLKDVNLPLAKLLAKTRHCNLTAILAVQIWRFVNIEFMRLYRNIVIWKGFSMEDFTHIIEQTPLHVDWKEKNIQTFNFSVFLTLLWEHYKNLPSNHSNLQLNIAADTMSFNL